MRKSSAIRKMESWSAWPKMRRSVPCARIEVRPLITTSAAVRSSVSSEYVDDSNISRPAGTKATAVSVLQNSATKGTTA